MKETKNFVHTGVEYWHLLEFNGIQEFYDYICNTPLNDTFRWSDYLASQKNRASWSGTSTFEEAADLLRNGWTYGAQDLTKKLKIAEADKQVQSTYKNILSMAGYQAIVPLYLNGVPNNMVNKKLVPVKQKVLTINKALSCSASVSSETLKAESVKCFQIIKKIEASGIRVNLNLLISTGHVCVKIRLKSANEKLNVSKLAFPLIHTAMFRRLYFRFIETYPTIPRSYRSGYGRVPTEEELRKVCAKGEILLPTLLCGSNESEITKLSVDELIDKLSSRK